MVIDRRPGENWRVLGVNRLKDTVKPGMRERFDEMRAMGIRTVMITGDNPLTAAAIAREAGVDDFLAEATPEDKMALIKREQQGGNLVATTGDDARFSGDELWPGVSDAVDGTVGFYGYYDGAQFHGAAYFGGDGAPAWTASATLSENAANAARKPLDAVPIYSKSMLTPSAFFAEISEMMFAMSRF